jgi:hypothetical protein
MVDDDVELQVIINPKIGKGPSIKDVRKKLAIFDPSPLSAFDQPPPPLRTSAPVHVEDTEQLKLHF